MKSIHSADAVCRVHQIEFTVPCKVAKVDSPKTAVSQNEPGRLAVVSIGAGTLIFLLYTGARRVTL